VSSSIDDGSLDVSQQISTDITIISDPGSPNINDGMSSQLMSAIQDHNQSQ